MTTYTKHDKTQYGVWACFELQGKEKKLIGYLENESNHCDGDTLYDWMMENIEDFDIEDYDTDGDCTYVAVMPENEGWPEYGWEFSHSKEEIAPYLCQHGAPITSHCGNCELTD